MPDNLFGGLSVSLRVDLLARLADLVELNSDLVFDFVELTHGVLKLRPVHAHSLLIK